MSQTAGVPVGRWTQRALVLGLLTLAAGCSEPPPEEVPTTTPPNILLISIDTLRADHLGSYGHHLETSPVLDRLASESYRFTAALAPTPWTFPSHASIMTGMHPYEIGIDNSLRTIPDDVPMLAELLAQEGYETAAFVDSQPRGFVGAERGFGRGFERYDHAPHREDLEQRFDMTATVDAALAWLAQRDGTRPFFLFLHTKAVHAVPNDADCLDARCYPYDQPEPYRLRFASAPEARFSWTSPEEGGGQMYLWSQNEKILDGRLDPASYPADRLAALEALYDAGIYYVDQQLGRLFDELRSVELFDASVIAVTSDHGEAFLEHSLFMHQEVYDTLLRVPLIVRLPGSGEAPEGRVVDEQVLLEDIVPTLAKLAGAPLPPQVTGVPLPLGPRREGDASNSSRDAFAYYLFPSKFTYQSLALRRGPWKLVVHNPKEPGQFLSELYRTDLDPGELEPLSEHVELEEELRQALRRRMRQPPIAQGRELAELELPNLEAIRSLGYIE